MNPTTAGTNLATGKYEGLLMKKMMSLIKMETKNARKKMGAAKKGAICAMMFFASFSLFIVFQRKGPYESFIPSCSPVMLAANIRLIE